MKISNTVDVVWRSDREKWVVEGGNGRTVVLGICSLHDSKEDAVDAATQIGATFDAHVRILNEPGDDWPHFQAYGIDIDPRGSGPSGPDVC
jgi:hypothetical protein